MASRAFTEYTSYCESIRDFAIFHNRKNLIHGKVLAGLDWVRIRPPDSKEIEDFAKDHRVIKFAYIGTVVTVIRADNPTVRKMDDCYVDLSRAGVGMTWSLVDFLGTFIRIASQKSWKESDDYL